MSSNAINYQSFMNYLGSTIGINAMYLHKFIISSNNDYSRVLSVKEACSICLVFLNKLQLDTTGITEPINRNSLAALSLNTAKQIISKYITAPYTWTSVTDTTVINGLLSNVGYRCITKNIVLSSVNVGITATGGGSGGAGSYCVDGDKNARYGILLRSGYPGQASSVSINSEYVIVANGGSAGGTTSLTVTANPNTGDYGIQGTNGSSVSDTITISDGDIFTCTKGGGGAGSGGIAVNAGSALGTATISNTRNGATNNGWSGDDLTFGGGGGGGGGGYDGFIGNTSASGPNYTIVSAQYGYVTPAIGTIDKGGTGSYNSNASWGITQTANGSSAGTKGNAGLYKRAVDQYGTANGGNGGNSGRITGIAANNIFFISVSKK